MLFVVLAVLFGLAAYTAHISIQLNRALNRAKDLEQVILGDKQEVPEYEVVEYLRTQVVECEKRSWRDHGAWEVTSRSGLSVTRPDIKQAVREMMAMETAAKQFKEGTG